MDDELKGKNQSYARVLNNQSVMRLLREQPCSATMLSERLHLSNASLTAILNELSAGNFIRSAESVVSHGRGRKQAFYTVNEAFGCIVVLGMSDFKVMIAISDMKGNYTDTAEIKVKKYDLAMLYELILLIKEMLSDKKYAGIPLLGIDIAVPGCVSSETGELQLSPQFDSELFSNGRSLAKFMKDKFNVPIRVNNDINMALVGEMNCGALRGVRNGMVAHIDIGVGGALMFDQKLYLGEQGFAGELGRIVTQFEGQTEMLDEFVSFRGIAEELNRRYGLEATPDNLTELYRTDERVQDYILSTADCLGGALKNIVELLNISTIVLNGRVMQFGAEYLKRVQSCFAGTRNRATACFSMLQNEAALIGSVYKAVYALTDCALTDYKLAEAN